MGHAHTGVGVEIEFIYKIMAIDYGHAHTGVGVEINVFRQFLGNGIAVTPTRAWE